MKQSQATELLDQRIRDVWLPLVGAVPYALNNETFRPDSRPFARFIVAGVAPEQRSMGPVGSRRFQYRGTLVAQLFGELDAGTAGVDALVDAVRTAFQSLHLGTAGDPLWTKEATAANHVQREGLHMVAVSVPFVFFNIE